MPSRVYEQKRSRTCLRAATFALYQNETLLGLEEPNPANTRVEHHISGSLPCFGGVCPAPSLLGHPPAEQGAAGPHVQGSVEPTPLTLRALLPPRDTQPLLQDGAGSETGRPSWTRLWRSWGGRKGPGVGWEQQASPGAHGQWDTEGACPSAPSAHLLCMGLLLNWGCQDEAVWCGTGFYPFKAQNILTYPRVCAEFRSTKGGNLRPT